MEFFRFTMSEKKVVGMASPMTVHSLRLVPGDEIKSSLLRYILLYTLLQRAFLAYNTDRVSSDDNFFIYHRFYVFLHP